VVFLRLPGDDLTARLSPPARQRAPLWSGFQGSGIAASGSGPSLFFATDASKLWGRGERVSTVSASFVEMCPMTSAAEGGNAWQRAGYLNVSPQAQPVV
jgi:hypothetical protein